jgi:hypothetical protein
LLLSFVLAPVATVPPPITNIVSHVALVAANVFRVAGDFLPVCSQNRLRVAILSVLPVIANICAALAGVLVNIAPVMVNITGVLPDVAPVRTQVAPFLTSNRRESTGRNRKGQ